MEILISILASILTVAAITVVGFGLVGGVPALLSSLFSNHKKDNVRYATIWKTNQVVEGETAIPYPTSWENRHEYRLRKEMGITNPKFYDGWNKEGFDSAYNYLEYERIKPTKLRT